MNGTYFYFLGFFDGGGWFFFTLHASLCITCLISSALLYVGSRCQTPSLILPHVFWQFLFIIVSVLSIIVLMTLGISGKMLLPSSIVLSSMMGVAAILVAVPVAEPVLVAVPVAELVLVAVPVAELVLVAVPVAEPVLVAVPVAEPVLVVVPVAEPAIFVGPSH
uniref:Ovule protein n=1 Tax=Caenorhabditis tropicalis TaxID=1561998 RepID=A0A1I7V2S8_9PELO